MYTSLFNRKLGVLSLETALTVLYTIHHIPVQTAGPMPVINLRHVHIGANESMVCCGTSLASLLAGLLGSLALRGRVAGVAITAIVVFRPISILIVIATVVVAVVVAMTSALADAVVVIIPLTIRPAGRDLVRLAGVVVGRHGGCRMDP